MTTQIRTLALFMSCVAFPAFGAHRHSKNGSYRATAYAVSGITTSGEWTHRHVVAADPDILPIGSRIKIKHARKYSGEYVVADTGAKIIGRRLDIYMPSKGECMNFGTRRVEVKVIELGDGSRAATKQADEVIKKDVKKDIEKGAVGNAATQIDWQAKGAKTVKAVESGSSPASQPPQK